MDTQNSNEANDSDKEKHELNFDKEDKQVKELDADIEKDLCDLWDMTVVREVCLVLDELNSTEIFEGYIKKFDQV